MVDEAHERTLSTDILFGLVKVRGLQFVYVNCYSRKHQVNLVGIVREMRNYFSHLQYFSFHAIYIHKQDVYNFVHYFLFALF